MKRAAEVKGSATCHRGQVSTVGITIRSGFVLGFVGGCPMGRSPAVALIASMKELVVSFNGPMSHTINDFNFLTPGFVRFAFAPTVLFVLRLSV